MVIVVLLWCMFPACVTKSSSLAALGMTRTISFPRTKDGGLKAAATNSTSTALKFWGAYDQAYYQAFVYLLHWIVEARLQNLRIFQARF